MRPGEKPKCAIAGLVSAAVVDLLKMVEVQHQRSERLVIAHAVFQFDVGLPKATQGPLPLHEA
jgi:hypothetical protein